MALGHVADTLRSRVNLNPLILDLGLTAATEFAVLVATLLVISLFGRWLGAVALGEYLLLRRVYAWLQAGAILGLGGALTRYVAHAVDRTISERAGYLFAALTCGGAVTVSLVAILNAGRGFFARWFFGGVQMAHLILPLSLMLMGGMAHTLVYGYYRGRLAMKRANALQFCVLVPVPIGVLLLFQRAGSVALIVSVVGVSMFVISALLAAPLLSRLLKAHPPRFDRHAVELLRYGVPRLPAAFGLGGLFALGPIIAVHQLPVTQVSYLLLGVSLLMGVSASAEPLGLILLSKVSMMVSQNRIAEVREHFSYLQAAVLEVYLFASLQLIVFADVLVRVWVGSKLVEGTAIIRLVLLSIPFYLFFVCFRSTIDAASVTAHNTGNVFVSFGVFLALVAITAKVAPVSFLLKGIAGAMVGAIVVLAWLTSRTVRKLYLVRVDWKRSAVPLLLGTLLGGTSLFLHWTQGFRTGLAQFLLIELVTVAVFVGLLKRLGSQWLPFFWNLAFQRRAQVEAMASS